MAANENVLAQSGMRKVLRQTRARQTIKNYMSLNQMSKTSKSYREKIISEQTVLENFFDKNIWAVRRLIISLTNRILGPHPPKLGREDYKRYKNLYRFTKRFISILPLLDNYESQFKENANIILLHKNVTKFVNDLIHYNDSFISQFTGIKPLVRNAVYSDRKKGFTRLNIRYPCLEVATSEYLKRALKYTLDRLEFKDTSSYNFPFLPSVLHTTATRWEYNYNSNHSSSESSSSSSSRNGSNSNSHKNRTRRGVRGRTVTENGLLTSLSKSVKSFFGM
jgi:hypothetical protein